MKIGINSGAASGPETTIGGLIERAQKMEAHGFDCFWMASMFGLDAMTALALVGQNTSKIQLGTAVVPSYPRHPLVMAQQAATTNAAASGRFNLGIGLSHKPIIEGMYGMSYEKPARHMREYLSVLGPALHNEGRLASVNRSQCHCWWRPWAMSCWDWPALWPTAPSPG